VSRVENTIVHDKELSFKGNGQTQRAVGKLGCGATRPEGAGAVAYANETANLQNQTNAETLLPLIRIFEEFRGRGYGGGYNAVRRYAGAKQQGKAAAVANVTRRPRRSRPGDVH
jgi:hypothetical protein